MVSKSRSPLLSAPQTLHLFLLSRPPKKPPNDPDPNAMTPLLPCVSILLRLLTPSLPSLWLSRSAAAFSLAMVSASASASGESGMVSRDEILGERERKDVGVEGIDDDAYV